MDVAIKSKDEIINSLHLKVAQLNKEIETQKELFGKATNRNDADTVIDLRRTTERLSELLLENERLKKEHIDEVSDLKLKLQESELKRESFEGELTAITNQDRAIREKCTVLEVANRKLEKIVTEKDYEILKQEKLMKEYIDEREQLLFQVKDANERADKYMADVKVVRDAKIKGDSQMKELQAQMDNNNPQIIKEQKDLIVELRQKVAILERELALIVKNSNEEIARLNNVALDGGSFALKPNSPTSL